jgi:hypothetical protein
MLPPHALLVIPTLSAHVVAASKLRQRKVHSELHQPLHVRIHPEVRLLPCQCEKRRVGHKDTTVVNKNKGWEKTAQARAYISTINTAKLNFIRIG